MSAMKKTNQSNPRALRRVGPADGSFCIGPVTIYVQRVRFVRRPPYPPPLPPPFPPPRAGGGWGGGAGGGRGGPGRSTRRRHAFPRGGLPPPAWSLLKGTQ